MLEDRSWRIHVQKGMSFASRAAGGHPPKTRTPGLLFVSDPGERRFLPLERERLSDEADLRGLPIEVVSQYLRRAEMLRPPQRPATATPTTWSARSENHSKAHAGAHPRLDDVFCQRVPRHPGKHGANAEGEKIEVTVEWGGEEQ